MCAKGWVLVVGVLGVACGGSGASPSDAEPGANSSRATRGGGLPDAVVATLDGGGSDGAALSGSGGAGGSGGSGGMGLPPGGGGAGGGGATPMDAPPAGDAGPEAMIDSGPGACEQGGICERLNKEYVAALARAQACQPGGPAQCMETAPELLECPDCPVWVTTTKETSALQAQAATAGCGRCPPRCPARPCRALRRGACQPTGGILFPTGHACGEAGLLQ